MRTLTSGQRRSTALRDHAATRASRAATGTGHDSTIMTTLVPTAMVFVRAKDGISHSAKEWSSKEDRMEGALALGKAVMNDDEVLQVKSAKV
jgi:N-carbamoyl-L-amino-acid hydrolase